MRLLIYIFLLFLAGWASYFVYTHPGNIELVYQDWVIDMPLWLPMLGSIAVLVVLMVSYDILSGFTSLLVKFKNWITGSNSKSLERNANLAWRALAEGDWNKAETKMLKAAKTTEAPLHYYLAAAKAAQELGSIDRRDSYLHLALRISPDAKVAVGITQAELQLRQGQYEHTVSTIQELQKDAPQNKVVLRLATQVYSALDEWEEIIKMLPFLKKYSVLLPEEFLAVEIESYEQLLRSEAKTSGKEALLAAWDTLPRDMRTQVDLVRTYAKLLLGLDGENEAEQIIRLALKRSWDQGLVKLYGLALSTDVGKQITTAEGWHREHSNDPALLLTLARLCIAHKLWGKARSYLEASIEIETNPDAYAELGRLLGFLGEQDKSLDCYKKGLLEFASVLEIEVDQK